MFLFDKNPDIFFICSGSSEGNSQLTSFDGALLASGIGNTNLIKLSSILPPQCREVSPLDLTPGSFIPIAYAAKSSETKNEVISAAVAIAIPDNRDLNGVIMEYSNSQPLEYVEARVRRMASEAMAMRGIDEYSVRSEGIETTVKECATVFAGVVLNYKEVAGEYDVVHREL